LRSNNAGYGGLVKNLSAVTDEKSGLLKRASYLDLLQAEIRRGLQQGTTVTVLLMQFGRHPRPRQGLWRAGSGGGHGARRARWLRQISAPTIWPSAMKPRRSPLVLGDTGEKEALLAVEKFKRLLAECASPATTRPSSSAPEWPGRDAPAFRPVDIVTEVANRADHALDLAMVEGVGRL